MKKYNENNDPIDIKAVGDRGVGAIEGDGEVTGALNWQTELVHQ